MELAILGNLLLFLGFFGAGLVREFEDDSVDDSQIKPKNPYDFEQLGTDGDDTVAAQRENTHFKLAAGNDELSASIGNDRADMGAGNDSANMGAGHDLAYGGLGEDLIWGGMGSDTIFGDEGNDTLSGFIPNFGAADTMTAADGSDVLFGGAGNDVLILGRGDAGTGGAGNDTFQLDSRWGDGNDHMIVQDFQRGTDQINLIYPAQTDLAGQPIVPTLTIALNSAGTGSVISLNGQDIATIAGVKDLTAGDISLTASPVRDSSYVASNYAQEIIGNGSAETTTATKSTALFGGAGADTFTGSSAQDYADMGSGNDSANMGAGDDSARGGTGNDTLLGGAGADTLLGEDGNDSLSGEAGNDRLVGGAGIDMLYGGLDNDALDGGADNDSLYGGTGNDQILGDAGADSLVGDLGSDTLSGGDGDDTLLGYGTAGEYLTSAAQNDGTDILSGGDGNDQLWLGAGDRGTGGAGNDTFHVTENQFGATGLTRIEDFAAGERIIVHYPSAEAAPVITLAASTTTGETNIFADGLLIARIVDPAGALTLGAITTQAN
jgi:Ca2+-binding RTX toxin-like protein